MLDRIMHRYFVKGLLGLGGTAAATGSLAAALSASPATPGASTIATGGLSQLFLPRSGRSRRSASWDRLGKNIDSVPVEPGQVATVAEISGTGCIRHIWMTVSAGEPDYLRRVVLRAYWDGEPSPSIESPLGDFFGVGHGRVSNYWSLPLSMVTGAGPQTQNRAALNCYFPMPFERGARLTVENQGEKRLRSLYYQIDYEEHARGLSDALRLHAAWRRQNPTKAQMDFSDRSNGPRAAEVVNLDGKNNYVILEAKGRGHYVGCNLSIDHINPIPNFGWFGEGNDMIYIDGETTPSIIGTGTEDYFCAAWGYPGGLNSMPYHGISYATPSPEPGQYPGKWTMYRYHVEDPVMFTKSIQVTIEAGHGNVQANDYSSVGYWYQTEPHAPFDALPPVEKRLPLSDAESTRRFWKTF